MGYQKRLDQKWQNLVSRAKSHYPIRIDPITVEAKGGAPIGKGMERERDRMAAKVEANKSIPSGDRMTRQRRRAAERAATVHPDPVEVQ